MKITIEADNCPVLAEIKTMGTFVYVPLGSVGSFYAEGNDEFIAIRQVPTSEASKVTTPLPPAPVEEEPAPMPEPLVVRSHGNLAGQNQIELRRQNKDCLVAEWNGPNMKKGSTLLARVIEVDGKPVTIIPPAGPAARVLEVVKAKTAAGAPRHKSPFGSSRMVVLKLTGISVGAACGCVLRVCQDEDGPLINTELEAKYSPSVTIGHKFWASIQQTGTEDGYPIYTIDIGNGPNIRATILED